MKLKKLIIENFRCYKERTELTFENITTLIGKNDSGKSTILEALDIFFNDSKGVVKLDKEDCNVTSDNNVIILEAIFNQLPEGLIVDTTVETSLSEEYLLNSEGDLHVIKKYKNAKLESIKLSCNYPCVEEIANLHSWDIKKLKEKAEALNIEVEDKRKSSILRKSIIDFYRPFTLGITEVDVKSEGGKQIWDSLLKYLPLYSLFQSDRKNEDKDSEIQDPMNTAIKEILNQTEIQVLLSTVFEKVNEATIEVANQTLEKLEEMNSELASELTPSFANPNWGSIFKCGLTSELGIPINKRGSGIRRLVLLNFFRAKVENNKNSLGNSNVIYAFEEPETALHPNQQKMLIETFLEIVKNDNAQIIFTTHSPQIAKMMPVKDLRFISKDLTELLIDRPSDDIINKIVEALGVFPEIPLKDIDKVKVALCVEGKNDIDFIERLNDGIQEFKDIIDIKGDDVIILPLGGSTLKFWVNNRYLSKLNLAQVHIYDSDLGSNAPHKYREYIEKINMQANCRAFETRCREMENYITPSVLNGIEGFIVNINSNEEWKNYNVPEAYAKYVHERSEAECDWDELKEDKKKKKISQAKNRINTDLVELVTKKNLDEYGLFDEVKSWFEAIKAFV